MFKSFEAGSQEAPEQKESEVLPDYMQMYEIPGQEKTTERAFLRYLKNKETQEQKIKEVAQKADESFFAYRLKIESAPTEGDQEKLIQEGLSSKDKEERLASLKSIIVVSPETQVRLIEKGLSGGDIEVQEACAKMIQDVPEDKRSGLLEHLAALIEESFDHKDPNVQRARTMLIEHASDDQKLNLVESGIKSGNPFAWYAAITVVDKIPEERRVGFIEKALEDKDPNVWHSCVLLVDHVPKEQQERLKEKLGELVAKGLEDKDIQVQRSCAMMIHDVPEEQRKELEKKIFEIANNGLEGKNNKVQQACLEMIRAVPQELRPALLQKAKEKLGNILVEPPLYKNDDFDSDHFLRRKLPKTGSEAIVFGGELKGKTILRHMEPGSFSNWQNLYEDHQFWKEQQFDYVPIEPIQSFKLNKKGLVDVYSGVLDLTFDAWRKMGGEFVDELDQEKEKIKKLVQEGKKIKHGHPHDSNFCLKFFRDKEGNVDYSRKPRIYLIDFDQSSSSD